MAGYESKRCTKCGSTKPLTEYAPHKTTPDRRQTQCRACLAAYHRARRAALSARPGPLIVVGAKRCYSCSQVMPLMEFYSDRSREDGKGDECKTCARSRVRAWGAANRGRASDNGRRWKRRHPGLARAAEARREARKLQATPAWANSEVIAEIYEISALRTEQTGVQHHVDHIIPLTSPIVCGLHVEHNLRVVEASVNLTKHNKLDEGLAVWRC